MDSKASLLVLVFVFAQTSCFHLADKIVQQQQSGCEVVVSSRASLIEDLRENTQNSKCLESCARLEDVLDRIEQGHTDNRCAKLWTKLWLWLSWLM